MPWYAAGACCSGAIVVALGLQSFGSFEVVGVLLDDLYCLTRTRCSISFVSCVLSFICKYGVMPFAEFCFVVAASSRLTVLFVVATDGLSTEPD